MASTPAPVHDNRKYERIKLFLPGQLFNPLNEQSVECKVLNLSAGGAAVQCDAKFPAGLTLVLVNVAMGAARTSWVWTMSPVPIVGATVAGSVSQAKRLRHGGRGPRGFTVSQ